jgi:hypothetical protein
VKIIKILGYNYEIRYSIPADEGGMSEAGRLFTGKQIITIDPRANQQSKESTLLHEIIEALDYHLELGLNHQTIMSLETGLYTVLIDGGVNISGLFKKDSH